MKKEKNLILRGYFDSNFGDDMMQWLTAEKLSEFHFFVEDENASALVTGRNNVTLGKAPKNTPSVLVTGSGFMINSRSALKAELRNFLCGKKDADYCIGCNLEPIPYRLGKWLIFRRLRRFRYISCRDKATFERLNAMQSMHCRSVRLFPDLLFSLPENLLPPKTGEDLLGIALMRRDGDADNCHYYDAMAKTADLWCEKTGKGVLLLALDSGSENDRYACACVFNKMRCADKAQIVCHGSNGEIFSAFARCSKIISARFHGAVLALKARTDLYPILFRDKMRNMLSDIGYPVKGSDIDRPNESEIADFLFRDTEFLLDPEIETKAEEAFDTFKEILFQRN